MPQYEHLQLIRLPERMERRRRPGFGANPARNREGHGQQISAQLTEAIQTQQRRRRPQFVNPSLILRVQMNGALHEDDWRDLGLTVLSTDADRTLVLFASDEEMR